jgi:hypothetical protein
VAWKYDCEVRLSAILLGWFILGETLSSSHFVGMDLITLGLLTIDGGLFCLFKTHCCPVNQKAVIPGLTEASDRRYPVNC